MSKSTPRERIEEVLSDLAEHQAHYGRFDADRDKQRYCQNDDNCIIEAAQTIIDIINEEIVKELESLKNDGYDFEDGHSTVSRQQINDRISELRGESNE